MAMNNHMEARRRQMFMERVCAARRRLESQQTQDNQEGASSAFTSQSEPLLSSDGGPSKTARALHQKDFRVVVFEKVVHDPNFYYRSAVELGENPPLHVNPIYKVIYPGSYSEVKLTEKKN